MPGTLDELGLSKEAAGNIIDEFELLKKQYPDEEALYCYLAAVLHENDQPYECIAECLFGLKLCPDNLFLLETMGRAKYDLDDFKGCLADLDKAIKISNDTHTLYEARAKAKIELNDFGGALNDLNRAIYLSPMYYKAFYQRAICRLRIESYDSANDDLNFVINVCFDDLDSAYFLRGVAKMRLNDFLEHC